MITARISDEECAILDSIAEKNRWSRTQALRELIAMYSRLEEVSKHFYNGQCSNQINPEWHNVVFAEVDGYNPISAEEDSENFAAIAAHVLGTLPGGLLTAFRCDVDSVFDEE